MPWLWKAWSCLLPSELELRGNRHFAYPANHRHRLRTPRHRRPGAVASYFRRKPPQCIGALRLSTERLCPGHLALAAAHLPSLHRVICYLSVLSDFALLRCRLLQHHVPKQLESAQSEGEKKKPVRRGRAAIRERFLAAPCSDVGELLRRQPRRQMLVSSSPLSSPSQHAGL